MTPELPELDVEPRTAVESENPEPLEKGTVSGAERNDSIS